MNTNNKLLAEIIKYPFIFEVNDPDYRNIAKHRKAWESISAKTTPNWDHLSLEEKVVQG